jgi:hypothetical protein
MLVNPNADLRLILGTSLFGVTASTVPALIRLLQMETLAAGNIRAPGPETVSPGTLSPGTLSPEVRRPGIHHPELHSALDDDQWPNDQWPGDR